MINYRKHIDDFFREKLGNYKETPPPEVWEELEGRLDGLSPSIPGSPYRILRHVAIISLLSVMGISVGRKLTGNSDTTSGIISSTTGQPTQLRTPPTNSITNNQLVATVANTPGNNNNSDPAEAKATGPTSAQGYINSSATAPTTGINATRSGNTGKHPQHLQAAKMSANSSPFSPEEKNNWTGSKPQPEAAYSDPESNTETVNTINNNSKASPGLALSGKPNQEDSLPGTFKKKSTVNNEQGEENSTGTKVSRIGFNRFEAGVKGGYELGFNPGSAVKYVVSPYLQYNISSKVAIMTQPAVKYADVSTSDLGTPHPYVDYSKVKNSSHEDSSFIGVGYVYTTTFVSNGTRDSVVKAYTYGGRFFELEMPLLLKYNITDKFSCYGGLNVIYSKFNGYTELTSIYNTNDSIRVQGKQDAAPGGFGNTTPYSSYKGSPYPTNAAGQFNIGYMVGLSYQYSQRWLADALIQQTPLSNGNNNTSTLSTTYFRFSIGYKLTK
jgi:hypothetical protein